MGKKGLGRGLEALIPDMGRQEAPVVEVPIDRIVPSSFQPRRQFDDEGMRELVESVREHGVLQPVVLRKKGERLELVAGERRWRAAKEAGLGTVPAVVRDVTDREAMEIALVENLQREDLNPLEEAEAFERLGREFGLTQEEIARRVGKSRPHIANVMRLLHLEKVVQELVRSGRLSMGHARALLGLQGKLQERIAEMVVARGLSVRQTEELVRKAGAGATGRKAKGTRSGERAAAEVLEIEGRLRLALGTRVRIVGDGARGRIEISYFSRDDLERIVEAIGGGVEEDAGA